jgi:hydroxylaminobenzene mutase
VDPRKFAAAVEDGHILGALYATYMNWLITTLAAVFGTGALSPITAPGYQGQPWQESFVTVGFMTVGITYVATSLLMLWGLRTKASSELISHRP